MVVLVRFPGHLRLEYVTFYCSHTALSPSPSRADCTIAFGSALLRLGAPASAVPPQRRRRNFRSAGAYGGWLNVTGFHILRDSVLGYWRTPWQRVPESLRWGQHPTPAFSFLVPMSMIRGHALAVQGPCPLGFAPLYRSSVLSYLGS